MSPHGEQKTAKTLSTITTHKQVNPQYGCIGCNVGHTVGDIGSYHTCRRCGVQRYRSELQVWLRHCSIKKPRYTTDTM
jgi:hypothetical protein